MSDEQDESRPRYAVVPDEELTPKQRELAAIGRDLFGRMARKAGVEDDTPIAIVPIAEEEVVAVRQARGGGKIYVASDGSPFFLGSAIGLVAGIEEFRAGARTPIEKFGPAA